MNKKHCSACGASVIGGDEGCQALYDDYVFHAYLEPRLAVLHSVVFDTYCMQHVETHCNSAKAYAVHIAGLCCAVEYESDPLLYMAIPRWLNTNAELKEPTLLKQKSHLTIFDVHAAVTLDARVEIVHAWAADVWQLYADEHEIVRTWIKAARG